MLQKGLLAEARALCQEILHREPEQFDALHVLGIIAHQSGDPQTAAVWMQKALEVNPSHAGAYNNRGVALGDIGKHQDAAESYRRAIALNPDYPQAHYNLGNTLRALGRAEAALQSYDSAIALKPDFADAFNGRGDVLRDLRRYDVALQSYCQAIALNPGLAAAYNNRANVFKDLRQAERALADYDAAVALKPGLADFHYNRGNALKDLKQYEAAVQSYDKAISIKPDFTAAHNNRGNALRGLKQFEAAIASYDKTIAIKPDHADAIYNRGAALADLGRHDAALEDFDRAIQLSPGYANAYNARGLALRDLKRHAESLESHARAIALEPGHADAHWAMSLCQLLLGDYECGWENYEWRWRNQSLKLDPRNFSQPRWLGKESLKGKTILLHAEQGFGDTLQFCRYVKPVADLGARVVLEVHAPMMRLLEKLDGVSQIVARGTALPDFDFHCPLLSLPLAFNTRNDTIPSPHGYLVAEPAKIAAWQAILGGKIRPRVGLAWSGNPRQGNDHNRSMPLSVFMRGLPEGLDYISLQKDVRDKDISTLQVRSDIRRIGEQLEDFSDTAALCALMDMVISVDTSVAHLAGALGKTIWVPLTFNPDWRWLLDRRDSPWYAAARLYRQDQPGNWEPVLEEIGADLRQLLP